MPLHSLLTSTLRQATVTPKFLPEHARLGAACYRLFSARDLAHDAFTAYTGLLTIYSGWLVHWECSHTSESRDKQQSRRT